MEEIATDWYGADHAPYLLAPLYLLVSLYLYHSTYSTYLYHYTYMQHYTHLYHATYLYHRCIDPFYRPVRIGPSLDSVVDLSNDDLGEFENHFGFFLRTFSMDL